MWVRLTTEIGAQRWETLRLFATYVSATLFAYFSRIFWPIPVTPHAVSVVLKATRNRASELWRNLAAWPDELS
jgi:hypothetical protein